MSSSLKDVFNEVNSLCRDNKMNVDESEVTIELFLGGDMKVIARAKYIRHSMGFWELFLSLLFTSTLSFPIKKKKGALSQ